MYCKNCGKPRNESDMFCTVCGMKQEPQNETISIDNEKNKSLPKLLKDYSTEREGFFCPKCESKLEKKTTFCPECGAKMDVKPEEILCSKCNAKLKAGMKFCTACGTSAQDNEKEENEICKKCRTKIEKGNEYCHSCWTPNGKEKNATDNNAGVGTTTVGVLVAIAGIVGLVMVMNYANQPFKSFVFGGYHTTFMGRTIFCQSCMTYSVVLVSAALFLIFGVWTAISGINTIKNNKPQ